MGTSFPLMAARGTICCYHSNYPADILIRLGSGGFYSHVAVANGDGSAICAWQGGGGMASGVINNFESDPTNGKFSMAYYPYPGDVATLMQNT